MKTREIEVSVFKKDLQLYDVKLKDCFEVFKPGGDPSRPENWISAKLIIPVEPEVVEVEANMSSCTTGDLHPGLRFATNYAVKEKLAGRRWKCKFEEIVE